MSEPAAEAPSKKPSPSEEKIFPLKDRRIVTPFVASLFGFVGMSGVLMFFDLDGGLVRNMHEWLGLGFVIIALAHIWRNWKGFTKVMTKRLGLSILAVVAIIAAGFIVQKSTNPSPGRLTIDRVMSAPISASAAIYGTDAQGLRHKLTEKGWTVPEGTHVTLQQVVRSSRGKSRHKLLLDLAEEDQHERKAPISLL